MRLRNLFPNWRPSKLGAKMILLVVFSAGLSVFLASTVMLFMAWMGAEGQARTSAKLYAQSLAYSAEAPLAFQDTPGMRDVLGLLDRRPDVLEAWVLDAEGHPFATYHTLRAVPPSMESGSLQKGYLFVAEPVMASAGKEQVGTVVLHMSLKSQRQALQRQAVAAVVASLVALLLTVSLSQNLARKVTVPVVQLAHAAEAITRDWSLRRKLPESGPGEIGTALVAFNRMVDELAHRGAALDRLNEQLRRSAAEAEDARRLAEEASHAKTRFLANMSHELRSPLNGVIGAAQLLQKSDGDPAQRAELLRIIQTSGANLLDLIETVLDVSRIEAGKIQIEQRPFDLVECVESAMAPAMATATVKNLQLRYHIDPAVPDWCMGDGARVRQLLQNLLGNAVKFTSAGEVSLDVSLGDGGVVEFAVSDTGLGIAPDQLHRIFEPFQQGDVSTTRRFGGSGLGLTICREIARLMGGDVSVESRRGIGSRFMLALPLPKVSGAKRVEGLGIRRVLCFEPDARSSHSAAALLVRMGWHCKIFATPGGVYSWLSSEPVAPDDLWLISADSDQGRAVLKELKVRAPAALVAAVGAPTAESGGGAIARPLTRSGLAGFLARMQPAASNETMRVRIQRARVLLVEDDAVNRTVIGSMVRGREFDCVVAQDGNDALSKLANESFDVVLMDWQMPGMDGLEATRRLRAGMAGQLNQAVPVIALTANAFAEDRELCLAAGMNEFLTKPVQASLLLDALRRWCRMVPTMEPTMPEPTPVSVRSGPPDYDPEALADLPVLTGDGAGGDGIVELLQMFSDSARAALPEMDAALRGGDLAKLKRHAHTWKSSAAQVGAMFVAQLAARLDARLRAGELPAGHEVGELREALSRFEAAAGLKARAA